MSSSKKNKKKMLRSVVNHNDQNTKRVLLSKIPKIGLDGFTFESVYPWLTSVKYKKFTNMLKNENEFASKIYECITKMIPNIYRESDYIFGNSHKHDLRFRHCHEINKNEKIEIVESVCKEIYGQNFHWVIDNDDSCNWYQVGLSQGIRIVGIYSNSLKTFYPLFCDWNHSVYGDDVKHNEEDIQQKSFNPKDVYE